MSKPLPVIFLLKIITTDHHTHLTAKVFRTTFDSDGDPFITRCRHYFISNAVMSGVDLLTIAKWVGHSSTKMIEETYGHLSPEYRARQMLKVNVGTVSVPSHRVAFPAQILRGDATGDATGFQGAGSGKAEDAL